VKPAGIPADRKAGKAFAMMHVILFGHPLFVTNSFFYRNNRITPKKFPFELASTSSVTPV
jgi:hypothetical protein